LVIALQAVTPSVILQLSARAIQELIESDGLFARAVLVHTHALLRSSWSALVSRMADDLSKRLAREITLLSALESPPGLVAVTEQQLADGVGSIRESVARALATFRQRGWIATTNRGLLVLDPSAIWTYARPERPHSTIGT
jgi:CRP-like cAMP-binding protein